MTKNIDKILDTLKEEFDNHLNALENTVDHVARINANLEEIQERFEKQKDFMYNLAAALDEKRGDSHFRSRVTNASGENAVDVAKRRAREEREREYALESKGAQIARKRRKRKNKSPKRMIPITSP